MSEIYRCDNCGFETGDREELLTPGALLERVAPGEPMPAGDCPRCRAFCHVVNGKPSELLPPGLLLLQDLVSAAAGLFEWREATGGWEAPCWEAARGAYNRAVMAGILPGRAPGQLRVVVEVAGGNVVRVLADSEGVVAGVYDHDDLAAGGRGFRGFEKAEQDAAAIDNVEKHDSPSVEGSPDGPDGD